MKNNLNKAEAVKELRKLGYDAEVNEDVLMVYCGMENAKKMLKTIRDIGYLGSFGINKERNENVESVETAKM